LLDLKHVWRSSNADPKGWGSLPGAPAFYADSRLDELAAQKLRFHNPELARQWDAL
jgi:hypothetical protein